MLGRVGVTGADVSGLELFELLLRAEFVGLEGGLLEMGVFRVGRKRKKEGEGEGGGTILFLVVGWCWSGLKREEVWKRVDDDGFDIGHVMSRDARICRLQSLSYWLPSSSKQLSPALFSPVPLQERTPPWSPPRLSLLVQTPPPSPSTPLCAPTPSATFPPSWPPLTRTGTFPDTHAQQCSKRHSRPARRRFGKL